MTLRLRYTLAPFRFLDCVQCLWCLSLDFLRISVMIPLNSPMITCGHCNESIMTTSAVLDHSLGDRSKCQRYAKDVIFMKRYVSNRRNHENLNSSNFSWYYYHLLMYVVLCIIFYDLHFPTFHKDKKKVYLLLNRQNKQSIIQYTFKH